jgi:hypothetical protein
MVAICSLRIAQRKTRGDEPVGCVVGTRQPLGRGEGCAPLRRPDFLTFALRFLFRIPILGSALSWRRSKATIQVCIGHGLQKNRGPCHRRRPSGTEYFSLLSALFCTQPILASRLGKESPYNRQLADDPCLILTRSGSELSPPLQDEVDPGVL